MSIELDQPATPSTEYPADGGLKYDAFFDELPLSAPGTLGGRYLRQFWLPVARSVDIPNGRAKTIKIMNQELTLYRGTGGQAHLVDNRCSHRGVQLSVGYVEEDSIRCLYHGWKFGAGGHCVERPGEAAGIPSKAHIRGYPTGEHLGFIWGYFGDGAPPPFPSIPGFEGEGLVECFYQHFPCNYFQAMENDWDLYHAAYTHRTGGMHGVDFDRMVATDQLVETDFGVVRRNEVGPGVIFASTLLQPTTIRLVIPPNNLIHAAGGSPRFRPAYGITVPIDDHNCFFFVTEMVFLTGKQAEDYQARFGDVQAIRDRPPTAFDIALEIRSTTKSILDFKDHPTLVAIEDLCSQGGQGRIVDRRAELLGRTDKGIAFMRRIWQRELQALSEGRPTKAWKFMDEVPKGSFG
jgi:5,5'-dehydrodivanillate O-demethylase